MSPGKNKKNKRQTTRTEFRKRHEGRRRKKDFTREFQDATDDLENVPTGERVSGKGDLTRKRTVVGTDRDENAGDFEVDLSVDESTCLAGRVLSVHGLNSIVAAQGKTWRCAIRGILKSLSTDLQHVVVAGDRVMIQPIDDETAVIVRVEPRRNALSRTSRGRHQILVSNVDQVLIVASASQPVLKPNLIDRILVSAEQTGVPPIIVINKVDLVDPGDLVPIAGVWGQIGYPVVLASAKTGRGIDLLRLWLKNRDSVVTGQSGVGKSSLLNAIQPELGLRVSEVSSDNQKGRHTTTAAQLFPLESGGHVIDTPGIRQFQLWDVVPEELDCYFREFRPYVSYCKFPNCSHIHEEDCQVKYAVADGRIDVRRYDSYCQIRMDD